MWQIKWSVDKFLRAKARTLLVTLHRRSQLNQSAPTDRTNSCPPSPVPMGSWQESLPPCRHSFSFLAVQKSHFLSSNTKAPTASPRRRVWKDEHKPCWIPSAQTQRAVPAHTQGLPSALCCAFCTLSSARLSLECGVWAMTGVMVAHPQKHRGCNTPGQSLKVAQGLSPDGTVRKLELSLWVLALKKKILPSTRNGWVCWWLRTEPGEAMSYTKNMGLNCKPSISKAITDPLILKHLETAQFKFSSFLLATLMIVVE